jgi:16S rRNA processing protein RimM
VSEFFLIATIDSVFGKDGFVKIISHSDFPDRFYRLEQVYIDFWGEKKEFFVEKVLKRKKYLTLKFKNFDDERDAGVLVGKDVFVDEKNVIKLPEGTFFVHDLLGSRVYRNNREFGTLKDVLRFPANDVYVIENMYGEEILIPAVRDYIESFNSENKILIIKPGAQIYEDDEN